MNAKPSFIPRINGFQELDDCVNVDSHFRQRYESHATGRFSGTEYDVIEKDNDKTFCEGVQFSRRCDPGHSVPSTPFAKLVRGPEPPS